MHTTSFWRRIGSWIGSHTKTSVLIAIIIVGLAYWAYHSVSAGAVVPQYTIVPVRTGTITQTISGTGQISASNQTDIQSQVSGTIETINVSVGQTVHAGDLIATIDSTNAAVSLQNAKISLAKLTEPAKQTDISNAQNNITQAYSNGFNAVTSAFSDLPAVISGMKDMLYSQAGFLSDSRSSYLTAYAQTLRSQAGSSYDAALVQYQNALTEYKALTRASATSSIDVMLADTAAAVKAMADSVKNVQNTVTYVIQQQPEYLPSGATAASTNVNSWSTAVTSDLGTIVSAENSIQSAQNSLTTLLAGADSLDIESSRLAVQHAQKTYDNYFIRAPYDGVIGRIPVSVYGQAGSATTVATIVGVNKIASISLNEVDAAKVADGQPVNITFDAIDGLNATGTVSSIDQVGVVSSGVVSYGVKIAVNTTDSRIKAGMSVNTSIVTKQDQNVLIIPSAAVKTQGNTKYVLVLDSPFGSSTPRGNFAGIASSTGAGSFTGSGGASSTRMTGTFGSSTRTRATTGASNTSLTVSSATAPHQVTITIGDSDDTNTQVISGLTRGQFVVTKTTTTGSATTATAPSILSSFGGSRGGTGGTAARTTGTATARPGN